MAVAKMRAGMLCAALVLAAESVSAGNWADVGGPADPAFLHSKALCRSLKRMPVQAAGPDETASLPGTCSSEALYYGIGMPANPALAFRCALRERNHADDRSLFSGDVMLMTMYANGVGAPRDLERAIALACEIDGAPAEVSGRVDHLASLRDQHWQGHDFSYCDDITSGAGQGFCAAHDAALADQARKTRIEAVASGWTGKEKQAFLTLRKAEQAFIDARAAHEVDMSGTARAAMAINEEQAQQEDFLALLQQLEAGTIAPSTAADLSTADDKLNAVYRRVQQTPETILWGTVTRADIRAAERAWLAYRDAWVAFARVRYPHVSPESVATALTEKRTAMLEAFAS